MVQKGKKKCPTPAIPWKKQDITIPESQIDAEGCIPVNRRGRQIRLPQRFRDWKKAVYSCTSIISLLHQKI
jgi:hypothetical protein